jgi:Protein of unknown function (DUF559)
MADEIDDMNDTLRATTRVSSTSFFASTSTLRSSEACGNAATGSTDLHASHGAMDRGAFPMPSPSDLRAVPFFRDSLEQAVATLGQWQRDEMSSDTFLKRCESPLEAAWRVWWRVVRSGLGGPLSGHQPHPTYQYDVIADGHTYRLDVVINDWLPDGSLRPVLAVELDGHTYHERTQAQVAERNARDRVLQMAGWTVLHFSYEEIRMRGLRCAIEVLERFDALTSQTEASA